MDELIRDMRDAADVILALPPYSRGIVSPAIQLAVMAQKAADELEKRRWVSVEARRPEEEEAVIWWIVPDKEGKCGFSISSTYEEWEGIPVAATHWMPSPEGPKEDKS